MGKRGFTIIELLIVMAVIALLVGIAIPSFRSMQNQAKEARAMGDLRVMKLALENYLLKNSKYPDVANYQAALLAETNPVLESNLYDPFAPATTQYIYVLSSPSGKYYVVYSIGTGRDGAMDITDTGSPEVTAGSPVYITNGYVYGH